MTAKRALTKKVPYGSYCYSHQPHPTSPFRTAQLLREYLATLPAEKRFAEECRHTRIVYCPYWRWIGHGRVRCKLLNLVAVNWSRRSEHLAHVLCRKHPKAEHRITGWLLGDAVKECGLNRERYSDEIPPA